MSTGISAILCRDIDTQSLSPSFSVPLRSWTSSDNRYAVDVLLQYKDLVIPIAV